MPQLDAERIVNLVIALRNAKKPMSTGWIAEHVNGYGGENNGSNRRQVQRDLERLTSLGIPVFRVPRGSDDELPGSSAGSSARSAKRPNTTSADSLSGQSPDNQEGSLYYIDSSAPHVDLRLTPAETGVVALASEFALAGDFAVLGRRAWTKLSAAGSLSDAPIPVRGYPDATDLTAPDFSALLTAITNQQVITFSYYPTINDEPTTRTVEPWNLVPHNGRWYLACFDIDRDAPRGFRLARIGSIMATDRRATHQGLKAKTNVQELISHSPLSPASEPITAIIDITPGRCVELTARAQQLEGTQWLLSPADATTIEQQCLSHSPDAIVVSPPDLRDRVKNQLERTVQATREARDWQIPEELRDLASSEHSVAKPAGVGEADRHREELLRLMSVAPYLRAHPGVSLFEAARDLGVDATQLKADIGTLVFCGRPGLAYGDLVDIDDNPRKLLLRDDQGLGAPVQLTPEEAGALLLALETVDSIPGIGDAEVIASASKKLRDAAGPSAHAIADVPHAGEDPRLAPINEAISASHRLEITYASASSDSVSTRTVDPADIMVVDGLKYLRAVDSRTIDEAGGDLQKIKLPDSLRNFLVDRIISVRDTGEPAQTAQIATVINPLTNPADPFGFGASKHWGRVWISGPARWLVDYEQAWVIADYRDGIIADIPGTEGWLAGFILQHGGAVVPLEPDTLRDTVLVRALAALVRYGGAQS